MMRPFFFVLIIVFYFLIVISLVAADDAPSPIYEQAIDAGKDPVRSKAVVIKAEEGSSLILRCIIEGDAGSPTFVHEKVADPPDIAGVKVVAKEKTVELSISSYIHAQHEGVYDCSVTDKKGRSHRRIFRIELRINPSKQCDNSYCNQNGICLKESTGVKESTQSCYCMNGYTGPQCQSRDVITAGVMGHGSFEGCTYTLIGVALVLSLITFISMLVGVAVMCNERRRKLRKGPALGPATVYEYEAGHRAARRMYSTESAPEAFLFATRMDDDAQKPRVRINHITETVPPSSVPLVDMSAAPSLTYGIHEVFAVAEEDARNAT